MSEPVTVTDRRVCGAPTKGGGTCQSRILDPSGRCFVHSRPPSLVAEVARRAGQRSAEVRREQAKSIRQRMVEKVESDFERLWASLTAGLDEEDARLRRESAEAAFNHALGRPAVRVEGDVERPVSFVVRSAFAALDEADQPALEEGS